MTAFVSALATATVLVVTWCVYAYFIEPALISTTHTDLSFPDLPESLDGLTICHISDIHSVKSGYFEASVGKALSRLDVDIIAITGDTISLRRGFDAIPVLFGGLKPRLGAFAVLGNGEHKAGIPASEFGDELRRVGIRLLVNESVDMLDGALHVIGVDDPHRQCDDLDQAESRVAGDGFRLLLAHSPDILVKVREDTAHLILAGHTHGGQIRFPFLGALWLHCHHKLGLAMGHFDPDRLSEILRRKMPSTHLYVSRGLGGSSIRARFMCRPEIAIITLRHACPTANLQSAI